MLTFSPDVLKKYPGRPTIFQEIQTFYGQAQKHLRPALKAADVSLVAKIPHKTCVLLQVGLRRSLELTDATVREINAHALVSSFVTCRSLFETVCVLFYTWKKIELILTSRSNPTLDDFDDNVMQLLMGGRDNNWGGPIQAKNILTIIDHVAKVFKKARKHYDNLSEFAHPNYASMLGMYQKPDNRRQQSIFIDPWEHSLGSLPLVLVGVTTSIAIINFTFEQFETHFQDFIRLCENDISGDS